ncbi:MAG: hypothetical protein AB1765_06345 [Candidatus Hydrogenedentota bacterium]
MMGIEKLRIYVVIAIAMATFVTLGLIILMNYGLPTNMIIMCSSIATIYIVFGNMILLYNLTYLVESIGKKEEKKE